MNLPMTKPMTVKVESTLAGEAGEGGLVVLIIGISVTGEMAEGFAYNHERDAAVFMMAASDGLQEHIVENFDIETPETYAQMGERIFKSGVQKKN